LFDANGHGGVLLSKGPSLSLLKFSVDAQHADAQFRIRRCLVYGARADFVWKIQLPPVTL
jgi:hypothetical protein